MPPRDVFLNRPMLLWIALVASSAVMAAVPGLSVSEGPPILVSLGPVNITVFDLLLVGGVILGTRVLLHSAGQTEPSLVRGTSRIVIAYFLYQVLVVVPFALWLGESLPSVLRQIAVRFFWIFLPVLFTLFRDDRTRKSTYGALVTAAAALAVLGVYRALTGGGAFYVAAAGELRYRVLGPLAVMFFAWPLAFAVSGLVRQRVAAVALAVLALVGQVLTNFRSGLIAMAFVGIVGLLTAGKARSIIIWAIPAALLASVIVLVAGPEVYGAFGYVFRHLLDFSSGTGADRVGRWGQALEFVQEHPFNDYIWSGIRYQLNATFKDPHNFVLEILGNEGLVGLAFYATILVSVSRAAVKRVRYDAETRTAACFLGGYLIFSSLNANWYSQANMPLLVAAIAALAVRLDHLTEIEESADDRYSNSSAVVRMQPENHPPSGPTQATAVSRPVRRQEGRA